jgi:DNA-binding response OmpR family regulator
MGNSPAARRESTLAGTRVLVVEDDALLLLDLEEVLRQAGVQSVYTCCTIEEALRCSETERFDAAIIDVRIGSDSIAPIARQLVARGTPFVFYTGQPRNDRIMAECLNCQILSKPAQSDVIVNTLTGLLKVRQ